MICETDYVAPDGYYDRGRNRHSRRETGGVWWGPETRDPKAPDPFGDRIQPLSEEALNSRADILGTLPWRDRMYSPVMTGRALEPSDVQSHRATVPARTRQDKCPARHALRRPLKGPSRSPKPTAREGTGRYVPTLPVYEDSPGRSRSSSARSNAQVEGTEHLLPRR